ncbi:MAG: hypothetical protein ACTSYO_08170 [Candidatus Ranarchaeia archaeon]
MMFGISIDDGWFDIIYRLSSKIEQYNQVLPEAERIFVVQIKEKFGGLRFYTNGAPKLICNFISEAEAEAVKICEYCGAPAPSGPRGDHWRKTLCDSCEEKREQ